LGRDQETYTLELEWIGLPVRIDKLVVLYAVSVDHSVFPLLSGDREEAGHERIRGPVQEPGREAVMLGEREPVPVILRSRYCELAGGAL
jgi:hypothetical protein